MKIREHAVIISVIFLIIFLERFAPFHFYSIADNYWKHIVIVLMLMLMELIYVLAERTFDMVLLLQAMI